VCSRMGLYALPARITSPRLIWHERWGRLE
jgi:hypothetical protein